MSAALNPLTVDPETLSHDQLISVVDELQSRVEDIYSTPYELVANAQRHLKLTPAAARVLRLLLTGRSCSRTALFAASQSKIQDTITAIKATDVHICIIRKAFRPLGAKIVTIWDFGYMMDPLDIAKVTGWLEEQAGTQQEAPRLRGDERNNAVGVTGTQK